MSEQGLLISLFSLTKRAPDAGDSAARFASNSFLRLSVFLVGRLRRPCPSAGNANRWAASPISNQVVFSLQKFNNDRLIDRLCF